MLRLSPAKTVGDGARNGCSDASRDDQAKPDHRQPRDHALDAPLYDTCAGVMARLGASAVAAPSLPYYDLMSVYVAAMAAGRRPACSEIRASRRRNFYLEVNPVVRISRDSRHKPMPELRRRGGHKYGVPVERHLIMAYLIELPKITTRSFRVAFECPIALGPLL
jgi:hypothetical protein